MTTPSEARAALDLVEHCAEMLRLSLGDAEIPCVQVAAHATLRAMVEEREAAHSSLCNIYMILMPLVDHERYRSSRDDGYSESEVMAAAMTVAKLLGIELGDPCPEPT